MQSGIQRHIGKERGRASRFQGIWMGVSGVNAAAALVEFLRKLMAYQEPSARRTRKPVA